MKPRLQATATGDHGEVLIYGSIGDGFWGDGVNAKDFAKEIAELNATELTVRINSPGGDAFDGVAIMNALKRHPAKVIAFVDGLAASAASIIAIGGADEVVMCTGSQIMIHDASLWAGGNAQDLEKAAALLDKLSNDMADIYAAKAGTPREEWRESMREETWFSADEATAVGLADRIDDSHDADLDVAALVDSPVFAKFKYAGRERAPVPAMLAHPTQRKEQPTMTLMESVAKKLGLPQTDLTEDIVLEALDEVLREQEVTGVEETNTDTDDDGDVTEEEASTEDAAPANATDDTTGEDNHVILDKDVYYDLLQRAARGDEADEADAHRDAEELVTAAIKEGRILASKKKDWVELALDDFDATKTELAKFASGTIPVSEKGRGGSDENRQTRSYKASNQAFLAAAGLN